MAEPGRLRRVTVAGLVAALAVAALAFAQPASLAAVRAQVASEFADVPSIGTAALAVALRRPRDARPVVLDARRADEFAVSHLPTAVRIDPDARALPAGLVPSGRGVVVYCSVGMRSGHLARRLRRAGVAEVSNLDGGIFLWAIEGRPLVGREGHSRRVHPYDAVWGRLLPSELRAPLPDRR